MLPKNYRSMFIGNLRFFSLIHHVENKDLTLFNSPWIIFNEHKFSLRVFCVTYDGHYWKTKIMSKDIFYLRTANNLYYICLYQPNIFGCGHKVLSLFWHLARFT